MDEEMTKVDGESDIIYRRESLAYEYRKDGNQIRVGVIGAGPSGLAAIRHCLDADMKVYCYEQLHSVGGIWNYNEKTGSDETGTSYHAYIYRDLVTNLPKEVMMYPNYPYPELPESYVHSSKVAKYLDSYAELHQLKPHIKFRHRVTHVKPLSNRWSLTALDLTSNTEKVEVLDAIFICSGPLVTPVYPADIGQAKFSGNQIHSKDFRVPEVYQDKVVLLIGLGPSGLDLAFHLAQVAKHIYLSSNRGKMNIELPDNVEIKPEVKEIEDRLITFTDDSSHEVDSIIYCTGYTYNYPFLDPECGVTVNKYVFPLYKHFISIESPSLFFIGLLRPISHLHMCDYQVRVAVKLIKGDIELPSKEDMEKDYRENVRKREEKGDKKHSFHQIGRPHQQTHQQYFDDLSVLGNLDPIAPVHIKMFLEAHSRSIRDFSNFRKYVYRILNDSAFDVLEMEK